MLDPDISSKIIQFFSIEKRIFLENKYILSLLSRTSCEQTGPMLRLLCAATIPVLNYHKPLTPARTKLFLHFDPNQLTITALFDIGYSVYSRIFRIFAAYWKWSKKTCSSFEIHSKKLHRTGITDKIMLLIKITRVLCKSLHNMCIKVGYINLQSAPAC